MSTMTGSRSPHWRGGKIKDKDGYVSLLIPHHPSSDNKGYVREHRYVMERYMGRYLEPNEIVHHLNEDKTDNRIENLVITNRSEHQTMHHPKHRNSHGQFA